MSPVDLILRAETLLLDVRLEDDEWQSSRDDWCRHVAILYGERQSSPAPELRGRSLVAQIMDEGAEYRGRFPDHGKPRKPVKS